MCWIKRKNVQKTYLYEKRETPPEAPVSEDAVVVVWGSDNKSFGEVFFEKGAYKYACWQLCYDGYYTGYYWTPIGPKFASFFDEPEKAKQAAEDVLQGYPTKT